MSHGNRFELYFKNANFGSDKGFDDLDEEPPRQKLFIPNLVKK